MTRIRLVCFAIIGLFLIVSLALHIDTTLKQAEMRGMRAGLEVRKQLEAVRQKQSRLLDGYQDAMDVLVREGKCDGAAAGKAAKILHDAAAKARQSDGAR